MISSENILYLKEKLNIEVEKYTDEQLSNVLDELKVLIEKEIDNKKNIIMDKITDLKYLENKIEVEN